MKNTFFLLFVIGAMFTACSNNGEHAATKDAEKVTKEAKTASFKTIAAGSHVKWRASHLGGAQPRFGKLNLKTADLSVNGNSLANATIEIDLGSLTVENFEAGSENTAKLTGHLKSGDFFEVEKFPTAKFELTNLASGSGDYNSKVTGNLTIKGVSKSITFNANVNVSDTGVSIQSEDFSVNRSDWGLTYNAEGTAGVPVDYLIADDIGFTIDVMMGR